MTEYHQPVMLTESIDNIDIKPDGTYVDVTFGGGGHSREILRRLGRGGNLYGFDQDADTLANCPTDKRFRHIRSNFRFLRSQLRNIGVESVDGILADLGVSSHHFDTPERGFSFRYDAPLDMRMNQEAKFSAADVVNNYSVSELSAIFRLYGELDSPHRIAHAIIDARPVTTVAELMEAVKPLTPKFAESKFLAKLFQALRIEVNHEMEVLKMMLEQSLKVLKPDGRLVVITYHSLEDRLVKNFMKSGNFEGRLEKDFFGKTETPFEIITRKTIIPTEAEQTQNPRSRSAKLRVAAKK